MGFKSIVGAVCACLTTVSFNVNAASINIDFGLEDTSTPSSYGAAGQAGTWNFITALGTTSNIVDIGGNVTGATLNLNAGTADGFFGCSYNSPLTCDYFFSKNSSWEVSISGLENGLHDVILYAPVHSLVSTGLMTVNGVPVSEIPGGPGGLVEGVNYSTIQTQVSNGQLLLAGTTNGSSYEYAGLSGIQISSVPIPAAVWLFDSGLIGLVGVARRKSQG